MDRHSQQNIPETKQKEKKIKINSRNKSPLFVQLNSEIEVPNMQSVSGLNSV